MKKRVLMTSIGFTIFFLLCTIIAYRIEYMLIPQVVAVRASIPKEFEFTGNAYVFNSCVTTNKDGIEGVWIINEEVNIWGKKEYRVHFKTEILQKEEKQTLVGNLGNVLVVQDTLMPLEDGDVVRWVDR